MHYRVLARKYRPTKLSELIGQGAMVRTLSNAFATGRLAHAFMLTGVRGVGKTTTARIIARALNCVGADGKGGATVDPCGVCEHCVAIAEDRHIDVLEMDAASRTGVDNIREIIDGVGYRPVTARFKIYIIDEVHMLSKAAFNALLKTLEEPPAHVKFVFATTEIRKVPVTVLSRCQRFDLRRLDQETLAAHLAAVAAKEGTILSATAASLLARAADGSVRDGLSLLDRAMAHADASLGDGEIRELLGLVDRTRGFDLLEAIMRGDVAAALAGLSALHRDGADPIAVIEDLLDLVHWVTRVKLTPAAAGDPATSEVEAKRGLDLAQRLGLPALARAWQMLLKGLGEAREAPLGRAAAEMVVIRLAYAAELPSPADLVAAYRQAAQSPASEETPVLAGAAPKKEPYSTPPQGLPDGATTGARRGAAATPSPGQSQAALARKPEAEPEVAPTSAAQAIPTSFAELADLFAMRREGIVHGHLMNNVHLVRFEPGRLEFRQTSEAPATLPSKVAALLSAWTGRRWVVSLANEPGELTLAEQGRIQDAAARAQIARHPLVRAVLDVFPGATIEAVRRKEAPPVGAETDVPQEFGEGDELL